MLLLDEIRAQDRRVTFRAFGDGDRRYGIDRLWARTRTARSPRELINTALVRAFAERTAAILYA